MKNKFHIYFLFLLGLPLIGFAQETTSNELHYEVNINYPPLSTTKEKLKGATTLVDLHRNYKPSWVKEYYSVEIMATVQGEEKKEMGKNDTLTQAQKDLMLSIDEGTHIAVKVNYLPENNLKQNEAREMDFKFLVNPDKEAQYTAGQEALNQYLKEKAIDKIPNGTFVGYHLAAYKFTITKEGQIADAHVFWSADNEKVDELVLEAICDMPKWQPATYANGVKEKQEWVLMIGNMESCVVNMLNLRVDGIR